MSESPETTAADLAQGVEMGKINDGYFSNPAIAEAFVELAVRPLLDAFGPEVRHACFGGGEGFLSRHIVAAIERSGRSCRSIVVDANPGYLAIAAGRGLETLCTALEDVDLEGLDLVTMRSVNHYNDTATQRRILDRAFAALKPGGHLASQNLSGPSADYCRMVSTIAKLKELGRTVESGDRPHITDVDEFNGFMTDAGFADVRVLGEVPEIEVGPAYYWTRFNDLRHKASLPDDEGHDALHARQRAYMARANGVIADYLAAAPEDHGAWLRRAGSSWVTPLSYPVHAGRRPG